MHPWHDVPLGDDAPDTATAIIEVPRESRIKYELDKELGLIRISHALYPPVPYPGNYGFFPRTLDDDGDPLDVLVVMRDPVSPLTLVPVRPIGVVRMTDGDARDDKVLCVMVDDPVYAEYGSFEDLPDYERKTIGWFFEEYQDVTRDAVEVASIAGVEEACEDIRRCAKQYRDRFEGVGVGHS